MANINKHIEALISRLQSPKAGTRYEACEHLRIAPAITPEAIRALQNALNDPDASVAEAAQRALDVQLPLVSSREPSREPPLPEARFDRGGQGMKCPKCGSLSGKALLRCSSCGEVYDRLDFERLQHLEYLLAWLGERSSVIGKSAHHQLLAVALREREAILAGLRHIPPVAELERRPAGIPAQPSIPARPAATVAKELRLVLSIRWRIPAWIEAGVIAPGIGTRLHEHLASRVDSLLAELGDREAATEAPSEIETLEYAIEALPAWVDQIGLAKTEEFDALESYLEQKKAALTPAGVAIAAGVVPPTAAPPVAVEQAVAVAAPAAAERARPPAPARPRFDWAKWWEKTWDVVVSGALLRGLLYLGALMIVVSAAVLVVRFWDVFPQGVQLVFIGSVPTVFYLAGWLVRTRLKLPQAGGVLAGIGALLLAVDFAAVYQFGGLAGRLDATAYWLVASAASTGIYALSAWRLPTEFFGYITLLGLASTLSALTRLVRLPLEWQIAVVSAMAPLMITGAARLDRASDHWVHISPAGRRLAHVWLLMSIALVVFVPGRAALGQSATFLIASLGFALLARSSPRAAYAHASVWSSIGACVFLLRASALPGEWYAAAVGALSILYTLAGQRLRRPLSKGPTAVRRFSMASEVAGWALLAIAVLGGFGALLIDLWAGVVALTLGALILSWQAYLRRKPALVLLGAGLFVMPFSLALQRALGDLAIPRPELWLMASWAGLALVYLGLGMALRRAPEYAAWLYLLAHALAPVAALGALVGFVLATIDESIGPTLTSLSGVILVYGVSAVLHDSGRHPALSGSLDRLPAWIGRTAFLWPVGGLLPVWLAVAWHGSKLPGPWLGAAIVGLGLAYVGLGEILSRRRPEYHWPPDLYAHALGFVGIVLAFGDRWALLAALYLVVGVLAALAFVRRWAPQAALASLLLVWPFELSLELSPLAAHAYSLAYALLASAGYVPLGIALERAGRRFTLPQYILGYGVAALAVGLSLLGRFGLYPTDLPWVGVATPLLVSALLTFGAGRFRSAPFAWAAVGVFAIAFGQALTIFHVPAEFLATAWVALALACVLTERALARGQAARIEAWHRHFRLPLVVAAGTFCALGLALTAPDTAAIFAGTHQGSPFPGILAQSLALSISILSARLYRNRWLLYGAAVLSFFPYTAAWIGYGPVLTTAQMAWTWTGLAAILLVAGLALDRTRERYAHGPYLVGYLLGILAIGWSAPERLANIYTLSGWLGLLIVSQLVVHVGRHRSFDDFVNLVWRHPDTIAHRTARMLFLCAVAIGFPIWLMQLLTYHDVSLAWRGLALALTAPLYVAAGLALKRARPEYTWPLYGVGYTLTALGAMVAFEDTLLAMVVLGIDALIYALSAYLFRQGAWLYLSNTLVPVIALIALSYNHVLTAPWLAPIFMGLAFLYFGVGRVLDRGKTGLRAGVSSFALPFYAVGYLLSAVALAVASGERGLALALYSSGVMLYALSAWSFRESVFLYPAVWLAGVPYYLGMTLTRLSPDWYGLGWLPLILGTLAIGRAAFQKEPLGIQGVRTFLQALTRPAMPFYLLAYGLSVSMVVLSQGNRPALALALTIAAALYFGSAALFRRAAWLFPGLLAAHSALAALLTLRPSGRPEAYIALPFLALTWVVALLGEGFARRFPIAARQATGERTLGILGRKLNLGTWSFVDRLARPSWAQPFYLFAAVDVILWQVVAQPSVDAAIILACGNAVLLGLLATRWGDPVVVHGSLALTVVAVADRAHWAGLAFPSGLAWLAGVGFALYLLARIIELAVSGAKQRWGLLAVWLRPLANLAVLLTSLAVVGTLPWITTHGRAFVASLAFCGALYLAIAYRGRYARLGYLGMAMLELAWILVLFDRGIQQPQLYAIPAGLYFAAVGSLEGRRGRNLFGTLLEAFGLCVLVVTSFIQSLNGPAGFPYFVLLLAEGLAIVWWGAGQRRKVPFIIGIAASTLNVIAQVIVLVNVYQVERWVIVLGAGLLLVTLAVFVERKREQIIARAKEWRDALEAWG